MRLTGTFIYLLQGIVLCLALVLGVPLVDCRNSAALAYNDAAGLYGSAHVHLKTTE